jgi:hypothetical protein
MSKNFYDLRFCVRRPDGYTSGLWRLWVTRGGDVFLALRKMAAISKYSFHKSGICRGAFTTQFTDEHGTPAALSGDRVISKWRRAPTPARGKGGGSRVAWIAFPTGYLSRLPLENPGEIVCVDAAPEGAAT